MLGQVRLKLQRFLVTTDCYVTDLCADLTSFRATVSWSSIRLCYVTKTIYTGSFHRDGKHYTVSPQSILTEVAHHDSKITSTVNYVRNPAPKSSSPAERKAKKRVNRSDRRSAYNDCFEGLDRDHVLNCAQAMKSIKHGCKACLVLVIESDIAKAQLNSAAIQQHCMLHLLSLMQSRLSCSSTLML